MCTAGRQFDMPVIIKLVDAIQYMCKFLEKNLNYM
jgi:hypothetical protein